jgi:hypothetical protein
VGRGGGGCHAPTSKNTIIYANKYGKCPERNWLHWSKNRNFCKNPEKQEFQVETSFV